MKSSVRLALTASLALAATVAAPSAHATTNIVASGTWSQGDNGATPLANSSATFCYLTRIAGSFRGGGEWVNVDVVGDEWYVNGASQQAGVTASANCVPYSAFYVESPGGVTGWTNWWSANTGSVAAGKLGSYTMNTWNGDSAVMLTGITGEFDDARDLALANQAGNSTAIDLFEVESAAPNGVGAWARTFFAGVPSSGFNPYFYGPGGSATSANTAGDYFVDASEDSYRSLTTRMAPVNDAFCYFTEIGGAFMGGGESVAITTTTYDGAQYWDLTATSGQSQTFARARCYAYGQNPVGYGGLGQF